MTDWKHAGDGTWVRRYDPTPGSLKAPNGYILRISQMAPNRFRYEVWMGATLKKSGECPDLASAQAASRDLADTSSGAPRRVEVPPPQDEPVALTPFGIGLRFVAGGALVVLAAWQFRTLMNTGDSRGFAVAVAGIVCITVLAVAARMRW